MAAAKKTKKKGKAYIVKSSDDAPGGDCVAEDCPIKRTINPGMTLVECNNDKFHASCATRLGIEFKVPTVPKSRRVE